MNRKKPNTNSISHLRFDLKSMDEREIRDMFMNVSAKSLVTWLAYYKGKEEYEVCKLIKEIRDYKNGTDQSAAVKI